MQFHLVRSYQSLRASFVSGVRRTTALEMSQSTAEKGQEVLEHIIDLSSDTAINMEIEESITGRVDNP